MTFEEAALIMMGGENKLKLTTIGIYKNGDYGPPTGYDGFEKVSVNVPQETAVIKPLDVTEPGVYNAIDYDCDGFDPVNVSDMYKKLYEQSVGDGENVTDDQGNDIPNAITNNNTEELEEYLKHVDLAPNGGSVTSQCLDADTSFEFKSYVTKRIMRDPYGYISYNTSGRIIIRNIITGAEYRASGAGVSVSTTSTPTGPPPHRIKITDIALNKFRVEIYYNYINGTTGEVIRGDKVVGTVSTVKGTSFIGNKAFASTVKQNSEPDKVEDYTK